MEFTKDQIMAKAPDLMKDMPEYYKNSDVAKNQLNVESYEVGRLMVTIQDVEDQLYINRTTWGLDIYEKAYNITPNPGASYEERREVIKAKRRGRGTTTKAMIKNTAEAFSGGEVDIIEHPADFSFTIKFVGAKGIPQNMVGFINMIREIKPAHLVCDVEYSYNVWNVINSKQMMWNTAEAKAWEEMKVI
ncbi:putative phage tail protein [Clostridium saccharoperbutylacetonicum]|uniref:putative phage tail protein n=1 Tax=Clostridium saccharoperbutylacetonicum TaxID=36745 RepID=UPI00098391E8|nr:putative phage tail protein [Clostridium saccharoperbutylacetonicum]AQR98105.1 hypothetical protein CLSAP_54560 [Clostridium saccharoperbutylacetonicum]NSB33999.1 hypothetical protein [Clostridium saccharoperbutylacetonicum]